MTPCKDLRKKITSLAAKHNITSKQLDTLARFYANDTLDNAGRLGLQNLSNMLEKGKLNIELKSKMLTTKDALFNTSTAFFNPLARAFYSVDRTKLKTFGSKIMVRAQRWQDDISKAIGGINDIHIRIDDLMNKAIGDKVGEHSIITNKVIDHIEGIKISTEPLITKIANTISDEFKAIRNQHKDIWIQNAVRLQKQTKQNTTLAKQSNAQTVLLAQKEFDNIFPNRINYFPHLYKHIINTTNIVERNKFLDRFINLNKDGFKTREEVLAHLKKIDQGDDGLLHFTNHTGLNRGMAPSSIKRSGNEIIGWDRTLESAFDVMKIERDALVKTKHFGNNLKEAEDLFAKATLNGEGSEITFLKNQIFPKVQDQLSLGTQAWFELGRTLFRTSVLTTSAVTTLGQIVATTALSGDIKFALKSLVKSIKTDNKTLQEGLQKRGLLLREQKSVQFSDIKTELKPFGNLLTDESRQNLINAFSPKNQQKIINILDTDIGTIDRAFFKTIGLSRSEAIARNMTLSVAENKIAKAASDIMSGNKNAIKQNIFLEQLAKPLGIDIAKLDKGIPLTSDEVISLENTMVDAANSGRNIFERTTLELSNNPLIREIGKFSNMFMHPANRSAIIMSKLIRYTAQSGDYRPIMQAIIGAAIVGSIIVNIKQQIRNITDKLAGNDPRITPALLSLENSYSAYMQVFSIHPILEKALNLTGASKSWGLNNFRPNAASSITGGLGESTQRATNILSKIIKLDATGTLVETTKALPFGNITSPIIKGRLEKKKNIKK